MSELMLCRTCLIPNSNFDLISMFVNNLNEPTIANQIMECSSVDIKENDGHPQMICLECYDKLKNAYEFKKLCETSDQILKSTQNLKQNLALKVEVEEPSREDYFEENDDKEDLKQDLNESRNEKVKKRTSEKCRYNKFKRPNNKIKHNIKKINNRISEETADNFKCRHCKLKFENEHELVEHRNSRHRNVCNKCEKEFWAKTILKKHLEQIHNEIVPDSFLHEVCDECGKVFKNHKCLYNHKMIHRTKKHLCPHCGHKFGSTNNLKMHIRTHSGERPYKCDQCVKSFAQKTTLKSHKMFTHSDERNFTCDICQEKMKTSSQLLQHKRIVHTDIRRYHCNVCEAKYKTSSDLKQHMFTHGDPQFSCDICTKKFHRKKSLKSHLKMHAKYILNLNN